MMLNRRAFLASAVAAIAAATSTQNAYAAEFSWDGTWSGKSHTGVLSVFKVSKGKVVSWTWKGQRQKITSSSVSAKAVKVSEAYGGHATLTPRKDGSANYNWRKGSDTYKQVLTKG